MYLGGVTAGTSCHFKGEENMANLSSASGVCRIIAASEKECDKLLNIIDRTESWEYGTWYSKPDKKEVLSDGKHQLEVSFNGSGRWAYANNVEDTFRCLKHCLTEEEWQFLTVKDFVIQYEFVDYEGGTEALVEEQLTIVHRVGQDPIDW